MVALVRIKMNQHHYSSAELGNSSGRVAFDALLYLDSRNIVRNYPDQSISPFVWGTIGYAVTNAHTYKDISDKRLGACQRRKSSHAESDIVRGRCTDRSYSR